MGTDRTRERTRTPTNPFRFSLHARAREKIEKNDLLYDFDAKNCDPHDIPPGDLFSNTGGCVAGANTQKTSACPERENRETNDAGESGRHVLVVFGLRRRQLLPRLPLVYARQWLLE